MTRAKRRALSAALIATAVVAFTVLWRRSEAPSALPISAAAREPREAGPRRELVRPEAGNQAPERAAVQQQGEEPVGVAEGLWIRGRAVSEEGLPLAGVRVLSAQVSPAHHLKLDARHGGAHGEPPPCAETATGADGAFRVAGAAGQKVALALRSERLAPLDLHVHAHASEYPVDLGDVVLGPGMVVAGRVVDGRGAGVEGVVLSRLEQEPDSWAYWLGSTSIDVDVATTAPDGSFATPPQLPQPCHLRVEAPGRLPFLYAVQDAAPGFRGGHVIALEDASGIAGSVVADRDYVLGELSVIAQVNPAASGVGKGQPVPRPVSTRCAADGAFSIAAVPGDAAYVFDLRVRHDSGGWDERLEQPVQARAGERDVRIDLQPAARVRFGLRERDSGRPATGPRVRVSYWYGGATGAFTAVDEWVRPLGEPGRFELRVAALDPQKKPRLGLKLAADACGSAYVQGVELRPGETQDLGWIELVGRAPMRVRVTDADSGGPIEGALVVLADAPLLGQRDDGSFDFARRTEQGTLVLEAERQQVHTDAEGIALLSASSQHESHLLAAHSGHARSAVHAFPAGRAPGVLEILLRRGAIVDVTVLVRGEPAAGAPVWHRVAADDGSAELLAPVGDGSRYEFADAAGVRRVTNLAPGTHEFWSDSPAPHRFVEISSEGVYRTTVVGKED